MRTPGQLLHEGLRKAFDRFRRSEPGVLRESGAEAIHDMRVSVTRMRSILRLVDRFHPLPALHPLLADLKWLSRSLGEVHDRALHLEKLALEMEKAPDPAALGAFAAVLEADYKHSRNTLHRMLLSKRYGRLKKAAHQATVLPPDRIKPEREARPVRDECLALTGPKVEKCKHKARKLKAWSPDHAYHRFRILCKRTRYAIECLGKSLPNPLSRLARRLEGLQTLLGRHQDGAMRLKGLEAFLVSAEGREPGPRRAALRLRASRKKEHEKSRIRIAKAVAQFTRSRALDRAAKAVKAARPA
jgi:CHAD domain-containing protein